MFCQTESGKLSDNSAVTVQKHCRQCSEDDETGDSYDGQNSKVNCKRGFTSASLALASLLIECGTAFHDTSVSLLQRTVECVVLQDSKKAAFVPLNGIEQKTLGQVDAMKLFVTSISKML